MKQRFNIGIVRAAGLIIAAAGLLVIAGCGGESPSAASEAIARSISVGESLVRTAPPALDRKSVV